MGVIKLDYFFFGDLEKGQRLCLIQVKLEKIVVKGHSVDQVETCGVVAKGQCGIQAGDPATVFLKGLPQGASGVDTDIMSVSVMEGDSVTLHTGVETNQQDRIRWYFNYTRIAQITGDLSLICTDVQCNEDTERFRDRLKLDHQTGSLTIMNAKTTDS
ncbi:hypothetical protein cypCar_00037562 [Cyprinus carpio]|nr:hypothetical protein cypCar_00037562 [Cyprinus carpio]